MYTSAIRLDGVGPERDHAAFRAPADRAGEVESGARLVAARRG